jgi:serine/threonine protein kinase
MELLHTTCGTPNYVAPEVLENRGYDGRNADVWSLGIILFVLVAGYLPFEEDTMPGLFDKIKRADFAMPSCSDGVGVSVEPSLEPSSPSRRNPYARARSCSPQKDSSSVRFSADLIELLENILVADPRRRWTLQQVCNSAWMKGKTTAPTRIKNTAQLSISPARVPSAAKRKNSETQDDENSDPNQRRLSRGRISSNPLHTRGSKSLSMPLASLESAEKRKASKVEETASLVGPAPAAPAEAEMKCVVTTQVVVQLEESALQSESMPPVNACCIMS